MTDLIEQGAFQNIDAAIAHDHNMRAVVLKPQLLPNRASER